MIKTILLFLFVMNCYGAELKLTKAVKRETDKSIHDFFNYNDKNVKEIWGYTVNQCDSSDDCLYVVKSFASAQIGYSYVYGDHECVTFIKKKGRQLIFDHVDCIFES